MIKAFLVMFGITMAVSVSGYEFIGTIDGEFLNDQYGSAISTIDFNNDGYSDLIVSAPASDEGGVSAGKVYLFYGGPSADLAADLEFIGPEGSFFGKAVSSAGDFNNDGNEDLLIGAPFYDSPGSNTGAVFLFYGGNEPDTEADHVFTGTAPGDYFGISAISVGDFNNDTYDDIAIGSYKADWGGFSDAGKVCVYYGAPDPDSDVDIILVGDGDGERFGYALTGGDFDDDGSDDIAVGAYSYDDTYLNQGRIYIFDGGTSPDSLYDVSIVGEDAGRKFGWALSSGNMNNDGFSDLVMGTDGYSVGIYATGKVYVFNGAITMDGIPDAGFSLERTADDFLGFAVSSNEDLNNDGYNEILVGMPGNDDYAEDAGGVILLSGGLTLTDDTTFLGTAAGEEMGKSVGFWNDYGESGEAVIILGASSYDNYRGHIYLYRYQRPGQPDCGDVNADALINILDITFLITHLYKDGPAPEPPEIGDVNSSGDINLLDVTYLIKYLYKGGPDPSCPETN